MKRTTGYIIGFSLFVFGVLSLILSLVGLRLSFLKFIDAGGPLLGFVIRMAIISAGLIIAYMSGLRDEPDQT